MSILVFITACSVISLLFAYTFKMDQMSACSVVVQVDPLLDLDVIYNDMSFEKLLEELNNSDI